MPNQANARKSLRQNSKRERRNELVKAELHSLRVKLRKLLDDKKAKECAELVKEICTKLDKAQARGIMKKNTVARTKSRLSIRVNALAKEKK